MAGINVPQYKVYKIGTTDLAYKENNWEYFISEKEAIKREQLVCLFESQLFRLIAQILNTPISEINFTNYILIVVIDSMKDFDRAVSDNGIIIHNKDKNQNITNVTFKRFVGTSGGLKNNSIIFVNKNILDELNKRCDCNRKPIKIVPAKLETYKALTCSASQPICEPTGIVVISDCFTKACEDVIMIDDNDPKSIEPSVELVKDKELINTHSDGFNLCSYEYMQRVGESLGLDYTPSGVCLRNAWLKGMLYPFPISEFVETYNNGNYIITDIWGNQQDLRKCEMILTESSLKLWKAYSNVDEYIQSYKDNGYGFGVTKIISSHLEDQRELNYQYLQSYEFTEEDIKELCAPTVNYLKDACCGTYDATVKFLGITAQGKPNTWQQALLRCSALLDDPYIIDSVQRMIRKKIDGAKIGKLLVNGNYQVVSGDLFAFMQHACGLEVTGLLKANEIYSQYWADKNVKEVLALRSPMTSHNNIRKCNVPDTEEIRHWFRYVPGVVLFNAFDAICQTENGMDSDGDLLYTTNNSVLCRLHRKLPAIVCIQRVCEKIEPTEEDLIATNKGGMGNKVGTITNRITSMMEVQSHFDKNSEEYKILANRILCGQLYQQNEIDKLKGIKAKPMPLYWYSIHGCIMECAARDKYGKVIKQTIKDKNGEEHEEIEIADQKRLDFLKSICVDKKPYFMTYIYDDYKAKYNNYMKVARDNAKINFRKELDELLSSDNLTEEEQIYVENYYRHLPFGMGDCAMNMICKYIESVFDGYVIDLKHSKPFNYTFMKYGCRCTSEHREQLEQLLFDYQKALRKYKESHPLGQRVATKIYDREAEIKSRDTLQLLFHDKAKEICPDDKERNDIILDLTYGRNENIGFCWDSIGDLIVQHLEDMKNDN